MHFLLLSMDEVNLLEHLTKYFPAYLNTSIYGP